MGSPNNGQAELPSASYRVLVAGIVAFLALALLTLLDVRRGFLFGAYPIRTLFFVLHPAHAPMFALGLAGLIACVRGARAHEAWARYQTVAARTLACVILALLVADLFAYRAVPAARSIAAGRVGLDWLNAFGVTGWWRPVAQATSFALNVWHATMIGILISGLALTALPLFSVQPVTRTGFTGSLLGALYALPQPFCSCCSSVIAPSFSRRGASTMFLLSFVIGAPMLNVTTLILAVTLLPLPFAMTRILAGLVVAVLVTHVVARVAERWDRRSDPTPGPPTGTGWLQRLATSYAALFDVDRLAGRYGTVTTTPTQLVESWLRVSGRLALVLVPTLWTWSVIASALFEALPSAFGNNLASVVLAAVAGTFFMISTWSEIPMALQLIDSGFDGPAAALLVVLPAVSLPCLMLLAGTLKRVRMVALLSVAVMATGTLAGLLFL